MRKVAAVCSLVVAGCAAPVAKEASMDWTAFIRSVPGTPLNAAQSQAAQYKTPTLKISAYRLGSPELQKSQASFMAWCEAQGGSASSTLPKDLGIAQSWFDAVSAWSNQEQVWYGNLYNSLRMTCIEHSTQRLIAAMLVRGPLRDDLKRPPALPGPVIAFYTASQAAEFADFYNTREKERSQANHKKLEQEMQQQAEQTRRLRADPKIGDRTTNGIIIDLRPPLALIQYHSWHRQLFSTAESQWVPISSLSAPR